MTYRQAMGLINRRTLKGCCSIGEASIAALSILLVAPVALFAQPINIDCGQGAGSPPAGFAAAAGQAGHWNSLTGFEDEPVSLLDTAGSLCGVQLTRSLPFGQAQFDSDSTLGDEEKLLDDFFDLHSIPTEFAFLGLRPGRYRLFNYAWAPDDGAFRTSVWINDDDVNAQIVGGAWPGDFAQGVSHAEHEAVIGDDGRLMMHFFGLVKGTLNGQQIVPLQYHVAIAPELPIDVVLAGEPLTVAVRVSSGDEVLVGSPTVFYRVAEGDSFVASVMTPSGGEQWSASLPGFSCGDTLQLYVSAFGSVSGEHTWPPNGLSAPHATAILGLDGDLNNDSVVDGHDIEPFVAAALRYSTDPIDLCHGDFDGQGAIDPADVPGLVIALLRA